jgi:hypothetical protein
MYASTKARFEEAYHGIADRLELPGRNDSHTNIFQLVYNWLCSEENGRWVLILDNVDDAKYFFPRPTNMNNPQNNSSTLFAIYLPQCSHGFTLVTSRNKDATTRFVNVQNTRMVSVMNEDQAVLLFNKKLQNTSKQDGTSELVRTLECIPLAITQPAAYIHKQGRMTARNYLDKFLHNNTRKRLLFRDMGDLRRDASVQNSVFTTWQISFERILDSRQSTADLLSLMSHFSPQGIPEWVLRRRTTAITRYERDGCNEISSQSSTDLDDDPEFDNDIEMLQDYSLISRTLDDMFAIHALLQFCTKLWLSSSNNRIDWDERFRTLALTEFPF